MALKGDITLKFIIQLIIFTNSVALRNIRDYKKYIKKIF